MVQVDTRGSSITCDVFQVDTLGNTMRCDVFQVDTLGNSVRWDVFQVDTLGGPIDNILHPDDCHIMRQQFPYADCGGGGGYSHQRSMTSYPGEACKLPLICL